MGNWEFTRFIISLWKLIFYLIFTPLVSHTSNSKAVGNGKWEIECVLPHKRRSGSLETGNGKLLPNKRCQGPSGKWEMGNWIWMRGKSQVGNWKWEIAEWEIGCHGAASIRETGELCYSKALEKDSVKSETNRVRWIACCNKVNLVTDALNDHSHLKHRKTLREEVRRAPRGLRPGRTLRTTPHS